MRDESALRPPYTLEKKKTTEVLTFEAGLTKYPGWSVVAEIDPTPPGPRVISLGVQTQGRPDGIQLPDGVEPTPPTATVAMLGQIRIGEVIAAANTMGLPTRWLPTALTDPSKARSSPDEYYATWAARYAEAVLAGSSSPIADLAEGSDKSRSQIRDLIHACRRRGFLTEGQRGHPGGLLTDKARQALEVDR